LQPKLTMMTTASDTVDSGMLGLQTRHSDDTSSDDDSDYDKEPTKTSTTMQWKVPIEDSDGEKFTCRRVREKRTKRNAKRLHNRRKRAALKKELIENTPFAEDAGERFVPVTQSAIIHNDTVEDNEVKFFPTNPHPFRTGTIIEENGFLFKEREMDGLIFYDSLEVLDDTDKTLDIIKDSGQYWTTCSGATSLTPNIGFVDT
jgi:hypothetical protein